MSQICSICGASSWISDASGYQICRVCGSQQSSIPVEVVENEDFTTGRNIQRRTHVSSKPVQVVWSAEAERVYDSRLLLELFNSLLCCQCMKLIGNMKVNKQIATACGKLWISYIQWWQQEGWGRTAAECIVYRYGRGQWHQTSIHRTTTKDKTTRQKKYAEISVGELSMSLSICFLYLACQFIRESVTMQQLCSWIQSGDLPYFHIREINTQLYNIMMTRPCLVAFFHPVSIPSPPRLLVMACCLAYRISSVWCHHSDSSVRAQADALKAMIVRADLPGVVHKAFPPDIAAAVPTYFSSSPSSIDESLLPSLFNQLTNPSLILRTWIAQLHIPAQVEHRYQHNWIIFCSCCLSFSFLCVLSVYQLYPVVLEIIDQLNHHRAYQSEHYILQHQSKARHILAAKKLAHKQQIMSCINPIPLSSTLICLYSHC